MPKRTRSYDAWLLKELIDPVIAANYINAASEDSDEMLLVAMRNVAEAHKMSHVAQEANVNRESLYKTLSSEGNPRLGNFRSILDVFGLRIHVAPKQQAISDGAEAVATGTQINSSETDINRFLTAGSVTTTTGNFQVKLGSKTVNAIFLTGPAFNIAMLPAENASLDLLHPYLPPSSLVTTTNQLLA